MTDDLFDELTRRLKDGASRRGILKGVSSLSLSGLSGIVAEKVDAAQKGGGKKKQRGGKGKPGSSSQGDAVAGAIHPENCEPNGRRCGKGGKHVRPCRKCCSKHTVIDSNGKKRCACRPDGLACDGDYQCCSGICTGGFCGAYTSTAKENERKGESKHNGGGSKHNGGSNKR